MLIDLSKTLPPGNVSRMCEVVLQDTAGKQKQLQHLLTDFVSGAGGAEQQGCAGEVGSKIPTDSTSAAREEAAGRRPHRQVGTALITTIIISNQSISHRNCSSPPPPPSHNRCAELSEQLANQEAEFSQLQSLKVELESEGGALRGRLEQMERERKGEH